MCSHVRQHVSVLLACQYMVEEGEKRMHSFAHHRHGESGELGQETRGRVLNQGWFYDLGVWFLDTFLLRGRVRKMRRRVADLAQIGPEQRVLDVGCGTGTLAIELAQRVGATGRVWGIDPGKAQIARARSKTAGHNLPVDFQLGVIEHLDLPDQSCDAVVNSLMMHHLPDDLKRQGLAEIARVLKPGGRLVIADFKRPEERPQNVRFGAGGSRIENLAALVKDAGFTQIETEEMKLPRFPAHSAGFAGFIKAEKV